MHKSTVETAIEIKKIHGDLGTVPKSLRISE